MTTQNIENVNVTAFDTMPTPEEIHARLPISDKAARTVTHGRNLLRKILDRKDHRLFVVELLGHPRHVRVQVADAHLRELRDVLVRKAEPARELLQTRAVAFGASHHVRELLRPLLRHFRAVFSLAAAIAPT